MLLRFMPRHCRIPYKLFSTTIDHKLKVTLLGKPNVGKSTLFNQLTGHQRSLIHPTPGLTRDCNDYVIYNVLDIPVKLTDTPGVELAEHLKSPATNSQTLSMMNMVTDNLQSSDLIVFMVDTKAGLGFIDKQIKNWLLKNFRDQKMMLLCNKTDNEEVEFEAVNDIYTFWDKDVTFVSAENGYNIHELWQKLKNYIPEQKISVYEDKLAARKTKLSEFKNAFLDGVKAYAEQNPKVTVKTVEEEYDMLNRDIVYNSDLDDDDLNLNNIILKPRYAEMSGITYDNRNKNMPIKIAVVGRPNSGKSTLVNTLLKNNRVITDDKPHTTRDPIHVSTNFRGRKIELIDTAGISKSLLDNTLIDSMVFFKNIATIRKAQIHVIVVDALTAFKVKDFEIIQRSCAEGRGVIVLVNKWDLMPQKWHDKAINYMRDQIRRNLGSESSVPFITCSAIHNTGLNKFEDTILSVYEHWNARISTGLLNNWLQKFKRLTENDYKSLIKFQTVHNILYVTQIRTRPPTFAFFVNKLHMFKPHMTKFFRAKMVEEFELYGVPVRIVYRGSVYKTMKKSLLNRMKNRKQRN